MNNGTYAIVPISRVREASSILQAAGVQRPSYRQVTIKGSDYAVFSEGPVAVLVKIQAELGVKL